MNINGLTAADFKDFEDLLIRSNHHQLIVLGDILMTEVRRRHNNIEINHRREEMRHDSI